MEDMISRLTDPAQEAQPSPIICPDSMFDFAVQNDPATGEQIAIVLTIWIRSAPLVRFAFPFDRLTFANFVKLAQDQLRSAGANGDG
jgi:hypothetical protein